MWSLYPDPQTVIDEYFFSHIAGYVLTGGAVLSADDTECIFTYNGTSITVKKPLRGYTSIVKMPLYYSRRADGSIGIFDAGTAYDRRVAECTFEHDQEDHNKLIGFFTDTTLGRGNNVTLTLGSGSGWFPFGPDLGDVGDFTIKLIDMQPSGQSMHPYKYWTTGMRFSYISGPSPSYSIPSVTDWGNLQIGTVQNLRYPESTFNTKYNYAIGNYVAMDGNVQSIDLGNDADSYETQFILPGTQSGIANVINYLINTPRNPAYKTYDNFNVITQINNFIFGEENASSGTYPVQLLSNELVVKHINHDQFELDLKLKLVS